VEDVVIFGASISVEDNAFEDFEEAQGADDEARFFEDLAHESVLNSFASFYEAAGKRPVAFQRITGALDEEYGIGLENESADAGEGVERVASGHKCFRRTATLSDLLDLLALL
jgi:hypothetical protein